MPTRAFPRTLVILPALNEGKSIARVVGDVRHSVPFADVLVINDGSTDDTGCQAQKAGAIVLHMPYRVGIGAGIQTGFKFAAQAGYEVVVRNDGDGQHDPTDIARLLDVLQSTDADMVVGSRYLERRGYVGTLPRRVGSAVLSRLISFVTSQHFTDPTSGFNAFNRRAILLCAEIYPHDYPEPETLVLIHRAGLKICEAPVTMKARTDGKSSITTFRSAYYMFKVILAILIDLLRRAPVLDSDG
jgi:glycosyltransferase involved in cell wall biosynthesis